MPSVAITWCERCGVSSEHRISRGPIPVVGACCCGGQRQISRIVFRPRRSADEQPGPVDPCVSRQAWAHRYEAGPGGYS